jgi:hypothetical protein
MVVRQPEKVFLIHKKGVLYFPRQGGIIPDCLIFDMGIGYG